MKKKDIESWFEEIKGYYDANVNSNEMDEGDFNVLEAEYYMLSAILK